MFGFRLYFLHSSAKVMFVVNDSITILILSSEVHLPLLLLPCIRKTSSTVLSKKVSIAGCSQFRGVQDNLNGWLGVVGGPLEYIENSIKSIKGQASQVNKNPDNFQIIVAAYPNVTEGTSSKNAEKRFPFSGRIDEIGIDIERIKQMGIFGSIGKDLDKRRNKTTF